MNEESTIFEEMSNQTHFFFKKKKETKVEFNSNLGERIRLVNFRSVGSNIFLCKLLNTFFKLSSLTNKNKQKD